MRISIGQILLLALITILLFGDLRKLKKKFKSLLNQLTKFLK